MEAADSGIYFLKAGGPTNLTPVKIFARRASVPKRGHPGRRVFPRRTTRVRTQAHPGIGAGADRMAVAAFVCGVPPS